MSETEQEKPQEESEGEIATGDPARENGEPKDAEPSGEPEGDS